MAFQGRVFIMVLFLSLLVTGRSAPTHQQVVNNYFDALQRQIDITHKLSFPAYTKYTATYFPKRKPFLILGLLSKAQNSFTTQEQNGNTAPLCLSKIIKLLNVFMKPMLFAYKDEKHTTGNATNELAQLYYGGLRDTLSSAKHLYRIITGRTYPKLTQVTRESLNKMVNQYKIVMKSKASVDHLRNWCTIREIKVVGHGLTNELEREIINLRKALNL